MRFHSLILGIIGMSAFAWSGCANAPGRPTASDMPIVPSEIADFSVLYGQNCAGCHGENGKGGAAISLGDPVYLAIADDAIVRRATANGVSGTSMPAFAESAGGMLTDKQIDVIVGGIRERWAQPGALRGATPPPYSSSTSGDASRGSVAYAEFCSSCHGAGGRGGQKASSIVDGSFLALLNDQELRTIVIDGTPRPRRSGLARQCSRQTDVLAGCFRCRGMARFAAGEISGPALSQLRKIDGRSSMTVPDGLTRRALLMKIAIFFNGIIAVISSGTDRALPPFSRRARKEGRL